MKFSLLLGVALLLTIAHIAQTRKLGCSSCGGSLGSGTNPCKCGDVVVKAAKVQKPLYHATPEAINEAATAREVAELVSTKTFPERVVPFPQYSQTSKLYGIDGGIGHSSSSSSSSSSSKSSSSSINLLGGSIGGGLSSFYPFLKTSTYDSGCGCGSNSKVSLELDDLLSSKTQGKVVPRFPPIGDLCTPNKVTNYEVSTKVTPAYPKLNFQETFNKPVCVNVVNGQIDESELRKLTSATSYNGIGGLFGGSVGGSFDGSLGGSIGGFASSGVGAAGSLGKYTSNGVNYAFGYGDSWGDSDKYVAQNFGVHPIKYRGESGSSWYRPELYAGSSAGGIEFNSGTSSFGGCGTSYGSINAQGSIDRNGYVDFGEDREFTEDYSYPRQPADAVSLTLAYKNLFPQTVLYNKKWFVPEDKLAFGHRTVPVESVPSKRPSDIPEERLQILDKPIVELKPAKPIPVSVGVYDEQEEAKLAELEAIERERINQEETASQPQGSFITYGDLGYAPVDGLIAPGKLIRSGGLQIDSGIGWTDAEGVFDRGCGPVGPPVPGFVPGSIVVNREVVEIEGENEDDSRRNEGIYTRHYLDDVSDEEDDFDYTTTGIFAKLRSTAQKYGPVTFPQ